MPQKAPEKRAIGPLLREWRNRRRLSQLDLSIEAEMSARHLSFVETGRSRPSRELVLRLAHVLDVPMREQNQLLIAAGFAPEFGERSLDDPDLEPFSEGIDLVLRSHDPYPCLVVDRSWNLLRANKGVQVLLAQIPDDAPARLLYPPINVLRLSLHPQGLSSRIANLPQWRAHVLGRLGREATASNSDHLRELFDELMEYPGGLDAESIEGVAIPLILRVESDVELEFVSMVSTFGTAHDLTLAELSIETFLPANTETAAYMNRMAGSDVTLR
ncbi:helix-turn-helix domain-containing protein [Hoyosella subflava]|uniref:Transcriptional regulator, XRE family n=1 Tax=Hoyosella subflava (strain DSM 45089 / JCM 17490 / NBRC 109087 / DQS3-9A1) TaxID=443218 RepID=F6EMU3_HOYSD|nr:helix-turn-helix transcriptional regulator [Hoyosella subflava]AEF42835.1 Transcriptional regulator, XRE family [Hoyosella subflava DQS3-9A1]